MQALSDEQHIAAIEAKVDKLEEKIDAGFGEMREEFKAVRRETQAEFKAVREEMRDEFKVARGEQTALVRMLIQIIGGSCAAVAASLIGLIIAHL